MGSMNSDKRKNANAIDDDRPKKKAGGTGRLAFFNYLKLESGPMKAAGIKVDVEVRRELGKKFKSLSNDEKMQFKSCKVPEVAEMASKLHENDEDLTKSSVLTRCNPEKFIAVVSNFSDLQRKSIEGIGFGSLLRMQCGRLRRELCGWLVSNFDCTSLSLKVHGKNFSLSKEAFSEIMGIVDGGEPVKLSSADVTIHELKKKYNTTPRGIPMANVKNRLMSSTSADDEFLICFMVFVLGSLLCPNSGVHLNPGYLLPLHDVRSIRGKDWATWCFNVLVEGIRKYKNHGDKGYVTSCTLFLQLFYLNKVKFSKPVVNRSVPAIAFWTPKDITRFMKSLNQHGGLDSTTVAFHEPEGVPLASTSQMNYQSAQSLEEFFLKQTEAIIGLKDNIGKVEGDVGKIKTQLESVICSLDLLKDVVISLREKADLSTKRQQNKSEVHGSASIRTDKSHSDAEKVSSDDVGCSEDRVDGKKSATVGWDKDEVDCNERGFEEGLNKLHTTLNGSACLIEISSGVGCHTDRVDLKKSASVGWEKDEIDSNEVRFGEALDNLAATCDGISPRVQVPPPHLGPNNLPILKDEVKVEDFGGEAARHDAVSSTGRSPMQTRHAMIGPIQRPPYQMRGGEVKSMHQVGPFEVSLPVSESDRKLVHYICSNSRGFKDEDVLVRTDGAHLCRKILRELQPGQMLSTDVLCMAVEYLMYEENSKTTHGPCNWYLPTTYAQMVLQHKGNIGGRLAQFRHRFMGDLGKCRKIYIPVHDGCLHWYMVLVKVADSIAEIWDPSKSAAKNKVHTEQARELVFEGLNVNSRAKFERFTVKIPPKIPKQPNGFDCGLFVIKYMEQPCVMFQQGYMFNSNDERLQLLLHLLKSDLNLEKKAVIRKAEFLFRRRANPPEKDVRKTKNPSMNKYAIPGVRTRASSRVK